MSYLEALGASDSNGVADEGGRYLRTPGAHTKVFGGAAIGDLIQWESNGALQLPEPRRIRAISDDGRWVFVEHSETGIPMDQVLVEQKAPSGTQPAAKPPTLPLMETGISKGVRREVFALDEGDVVLTFPENMSATSFADLDAYLKVFIAKMRRRSGVPEERTKKDAS